MKHLKHQIARLMILFCDLAIAARDKAIGRQSIGISKAAIRIFDSPWPPGAEHRSFRDGAGTVWFQLHPGASTPPEIYAACQRRLLCSN